MKPTIFAIQVYPDGDTEISKVYPSPFLNQDLITTYSIKKVKQELIDYGHTEACIDEAIKLLIKAKPNEPVEV